MAEAATAAIMHARWAAIFPFAIRTRPVSNSAALVPLSVAFRAGKKAYCSAITRPASSYGGLPSATPVRTSRGKTAREWRLPTIGGKWFRQRGKEELAGLQLRKSAG